MSSNEETHEDVVALAEEVAREAGELLLSFYADGEPLGEVASTIERKSSRTDLVTSADRASEELVRQRLCSSRPNDAILGEEEGARRGTSGFTWVVDPLDGTVNFVYGFPAFAVSIACVDPDGAIAGAVYDPVRAEMFTARRGGGALRNGTPLRIGVPPPLSEALVATGFSYSSERRAHQARLLPAVLPAVGDIRRAGAAALDLCWLAAGRLDACYEAGLAPWDLAAGRLVVEEAGGRVTLVDGVVPGAATVVAAAPGLHEELVALLRQASHAPLEPKGLVVRHMRHDDLAELETVLQRVHDAHGYPSRLPERTERFLCNERTTHSLVATLSGRVVGHVALARAEGDAALGLFEEGSGRGASDLAVVKRLFVDPPREHGGIGRRLLAEAVAAAHRDHKQPVLDVSSVSAYAISLYERAGFSFVGTIDLSWPGQETPFPVRCYVGPPAPSN